MPGIQPNCLKCLQMICCVTGQTFLTSTSQSSKDSIDTLAEVDKEIDTPYWQEMDNMDTQVDTQIEGSQIADDIVGNIEGLMDSEGDSAVVTHDSSSMQYGKEGCFCTE